MLEICEINKHYGCASFNRLNGLIIDKSQINI